MAFRFAGCSAELMADLSQAAPSRMVTEGAVLHSRGDHSDALLLVLRGAVKVMAGEECVQELRPPGLRDWLGLKPVLFFQQVWWVLVALDGRFRGFSGGFRWSSWVFPWFL